MRSRAGSGTFGSVRRRKFGWALGSLQGCDFSAARRREAASVSRRPSGDGYLRSPRAMGAAISRMRIISRRRTRMCVIGRRPMRMTMRMRIGAEVHSSSSLLLGWVCNAGGRTKQADLCKTLRLFFVGLRPQCLLPRICGFPLFSSQKCDSCDLYKFIEKIFSMSWGGLFWYR